MMALAAWDTGRHTGCSGWESWWRVEVASSSIGGCASRVSLPDDDEGGEGNGLTACGLSRTGSPRVSISSEEGVAGECVIIGIPALWWESRETPSKSLVVEPLELASTMCRGGARGVGCSSWA